MHIDCVSTGIDTDYIKIIIPVFIVVIGWMVNHYFADKRAVTSRRQDLVIKHLIDTYSTLTSGIFLDGLTTPEKDEKFGAILSGIYLYGSPKQVELARVFGKKMLAEGVYDKNTLVKSLRDSLRNELNLENVSGDEKP